MSSRLGAGYPCAVDTAPRGGSGAKVGTFGAGGSRTLDARASGLLGRALGGAPPPVTPEAEALVAPIPGARAGTTLGTAETALGGRTLGVRAGTALGGLTLGARAGTALSGVRVGTALGERTLGVCVGTALGGRTLAILAAARGAGGGGKVGGRLGARGGSVGGRAIGAAVGGRGAAGLDVCDAGALPGASGGGRAAGGTDGGGGRYEGVALSVGA